MTADPATTRAVYDRQAAVYDRGRSRALFEARWLTRFANALAPGARVLDLGCGAGEPIAAWLIAEGFKITGVDFSEEMLKIARARWPDGDWRLGDMRQLEMDDTFAGIVAWDSFFHLTPDEQRVVIPRLARRLGPEGLLMTTVGPYAGEVSGTVGGEPVYHASLSPAGYAEALEGAGMRMTAFMAEDPNCDRHSILMARKVK